METVVEEEFKLELYNKFKFTWDLEINFFAR